VLYGNPIAGNQPANPTPFKFGVLQEVDVSFKGDLKKLFGQKQFAVATARGKLDCTVKGKLAVFDIAMINQLYFAQTPVAGIDLTVDDELRTITTNVATVTNTPIAEDWGVRYKATGQQLTFVPNTASVTTPGLYTVNLTSGTYTFDETDGTQVLISYLYHVNSRGSTLTLNNQLMGYAPELKMLLYNKFRNKYLAIELNDVTLGSMSFPTKLEDFWISDFDGSANADATDTIARLMMDLV